MVHIGLSCKTIVDWNDKIRSKVALRDELLYGQQIDPLKLHRLMNVVFTRIKG